MRTTASAGALGAAARRAARRKTTAIVGAEILVLLRVARSRLALWRERARSRRQLARLDPHMLKDIGLHPIVAENEAHKPFWRE